MLRSRLTHVTEPGATYFITLTLLDRTVDLADPRIAPIVIATLKHFEEQRYLLFDYVVMPDHVHFLMKPLKINGDWFPLSRIYHSVTSFTANEINRVVGRVGPLWQDDTYDRGGEGGATTRRKRDMSSSTRSSVGW